jgi:carbamoyl-phosphate synthase small subunit
MKTARLAFEDGKIFYGEAFAGHGERFGEIVFNTAMTGYQEVLTDPSYCGQMVVMTYPLMGSYGINPQDIESRALFLEALIVKEYIDFPSHFLSEKSLKDYLLENNILGVEGFDTRALTRYLREKGAQKAILTTLDDSDEVIVRKAKESTGMVGQNLVSKVTTPEPYVWEKQESSAFKVAVIDCGVKFNILRMLTKAGCECHVFPASVKAEDIVGKGFDGIFISNGPGDPETVKPVIKLIQDALGKLPLFGICLGHQLFGLALGGKTYKLKFGHHGANHPVKNLLTNKVEITSQNHGFCVDFDSLDPNTAEITHLNLNDQTVEGIRHKAYPAFSVQYHPEAGPGPSDSLYLFDEFIQKMKTNKGLQ